MDGSTAVDWFTDFRRPERLVKGSTVGGQKDGLED